MEVGDRVKHNNGFFGTIVAIGPTRYGGQWVVLETDQPDKFGVTLARGDFLTVVDKIVDVRKVEALVVSLQEELQNDMNMILKPHHTEVVELIDHQITTRLREFLVKVSVVSEDRP